MWIGKCVGSVKGSVDWEMSRKYKREVWIGKCVESIKGSVDWKMCRKCKGKCGLENV